MLNRNYLGEFEHIVVLALLRLGDRAYRVTVRPEIETRALVARCRSAPSTPLSLPWQGKVTSSLTLAILPRARRTIERFFQVTAKGVAAVNRIQRALQSMTAGLDLVEKCS
jgi:PadR family transcriptional regulator PadR